MKIFLLLNLHTNAHTYVLHLLLNIDILISYVLSMLVSLVVSLFLLLTVYFRLVYNFFNGRICQFQEANINGNVDFLVSRKFSSDLLHVLSYRCWVVLCYSLFLVREGEWIFMWNILLLFCF